MKLTKNVVAVAAFVLLLGAAAVQTTNAAGAADSATSQKADSKSSAAADQKTEDQSSTSESEKANSKAADKAATSNAAADAESSSLAPGEKPEPKVTEGKASKGEKKRLVAYLEITNDQTGKAVRYGEVYATKDSTGTKLDKEKSGWTGMTYNDIPSFPRFDLTPAEIKTDVEAVGVTATNKQTWSITQHKVSYE
ncbi:hypothetical protein [Lacticaseibacillus kribbianus]|uniref:hypothetical protein n=1 Tax=Lacticaseibacillus kribbianus TaxID=2926292 RepID=UPI001CD3EB42|nr:hypothetical protein [Lacticaseibacillus kribbianus]